MTIKPTNVAIVKSKGLIKIIFNPNVAPKKHGKTICLESNEFEALVERIMLDHEDFLKML